MELIAKCLVGVLGGFISHKAFYQPSYAFGKRWGQLIRYAIGYVCCMPIRQLFLDPNEKRVSDRVFISDVLTATMYGAGVFVGYLLDTEE